MKTEAIWFIAGLAFMVVELALPRAILVFLGLGAWAAGLAAYMGWASSSGIQLIVFLLASALMFAALRRPLVKMLSSEES